MKNLPERIYLQVDPDNENPEDFNELFGVTWCTERINKSDIEYVLWQNNSYKRLLFNAYLQGKRDQIIWPTKYEELEPVGKYRVIKKFLNWYFRPVNKH